MSRTTPRSFYLEFVQPNYQDYLQSPENVRRGINACVSAFQLADIMYAFYKQNDPSKLTEWNSKQDFLINLRRREPLFATVQSVATAYKHLYPTASHYVIDSPGDLFGLELPKDGPDLSSDTGTDVFVKQRDGSRVSLKNALEAVVNKLWPSVLPSES